MTTRASILAPLAVALFGCNLITGANDFEIATGGGVAQGGNGAASTGDGAGETSTGASTSTGAQNAGGAGPSGGGDPTGGSGPGPDCPTACGASEHCDAATHTCVCDPGFVDEGGTCSPVDPGDPTLRTAQEVCDRWAQDHQITEPDPFDSSGAQCDPGTLKQGGIDDTLVRINLFRWLSGLGPTSDDPALNAVDQKCANLEAWWDFSNPNSPHSPPPSSTCYTSEGASGAGMSNIAWGNGPADSIDQFMEDNGNATTMGHRRWIVNPPLGPVGIGYWEGGGTYGSAECLAVFGSSGGGPNPPWVAVPNQGYVPLTIAQWTWTFHGNDSGIPTATIAVTRVGDGADLPVTVQQLQQGFGQNTISWVPNGWQPAANETYRVTVSGLTSGSVTYDVKPVACN